MTHRVLRRSLRASFGPIVALLATMGLVVSGGGPVAAGTVGHGISSLAIAGPTPFLAGGPATLRAGPSTADSGGGSTKDPSSRATTSAVASPFVSGSTRAGTPPRARAALLRAGWPAAPSRAPPLLPF